ncbi:MAG: phosphatidate cytidylyltransferase, partial [Acidimicrobiales bacterium]
VPGEATVPGAATAGPQASRVAAAAGKEARGTLFDEFRQALAGATAAGILPSGGTANGSGELPPSTAPTGPEPGAPAATGAEGRVSGEPEEAGMRARALPGRRRFLVGAGPAGRRPGGTATTSEVQREAGTGSVAPGSPGRGAPAPDGARHRPRRPYDLRADDASRPGASGRDVGAAVATGAGLVVLFVACYVIGTTALLALSAVAILGCALEAFSMLQRAGFRPATLVAALGSAGAVLAAYWRGQGSLAVIFVVVVAASLTWYLAGVVEARPVVNVAVTVMGFAWVGVLGSFAGLLLAAHSGEHLFLGAVVPTVAADAAAWFGGSRVGSHALAPRVSPAKTWEGVIAGGVVAIVAGVAIGHWLAPWGGIRHGLELGVLIAIVAPVGDLVQSMVKRDLRLKDSGALLPGHGGLLDRFDSLLFALPATYYLATVLHLVK